MTQMIRYLILNLIGLLLAAFGAYAAINNYPSPGEVRAWSKALPTLGAMLGFSLDIAAVAVGLAILLPFLWRLRRSQAQSASISAVPTYSRAPRPVPAGHYDDEYEPEPAGYGAEGYGGSHGGTGRGYFDSAGDRFRDNGAYRQFDERRRPGSFR